MSTVKGNGTNMEAHILEMANRASRMLLDPVLLAVAVIGVLAVMTGVAQRLTVTIEDILQSRK